MIFAWMYSLYNCTAVLLDTCTAVLLDKCTAVLLDNCTAVLKYWNMYEKVCIVLKALENL